MDPFLLFLKSNVALIALVSLIVAILGLWLNHITRIEREKDVKIWVVSIDPLFSENNVNKELFKIIYDDEVFSNVSITTVLIQNLGAIPIIPADFQRMQFNFDENSVVIDAVQIGATQNSIDAKLSHHRNNLHIASKSLVRVEPFLLNQGAELWLQFIVSKTTGCIPDAFIVGVRNTHPAQYISSKVIAYKPWRRSARRFR